MLQKRKSQQRGGGRRKEGKETAKEGKRKEKRSTEEKERRREGEKERARPKRKKGTRGRRRTGKPGGRGRKGPNEGKGRTRRKGKERPPRFVENHLTTIAKRSVINLMYLQQTAFTHFGRPLHPDISKEFPRVKNIGSTHGIALPTRRLALTVAPCPYSYHS